MNESAEILKTICERYKLTSLLQQIYSAEKNLSVKKVEIAVFGQFKSGKSSFINSLVGKELLPVGVIPLTAVITKVGFDKNERAIIEYDDGKTNEVDIADIKNYITEKENPENVKGVRTVNVFTRLMSDFQNIVFVDTPGLGSIYQHNSETTIKWSGESIVAVFCISAERPMSKEDIDFFKELMAISGRQVIVITKADLFDSGKLDEIRLFVENSVFSGFNTKVPCYFYSVFKNEEGYRQYFIHHFLSEYQAVGEEKLKEIYYQKLMKIAQNVQQYLTIARINEQKSIEEKQQLLLKIREEERSLTNLEYELNLLVQDYRNRIREQLEAVLLAYHPRIVEETKRKYDEEFSTLNGTLNVVSRNFENWLKGFLQDKMSEVLEKEDAGFREKLIEIRDNFKFYYESFQDKFHEKTFQLLGVRISDAKIEINFGPVKRPDISVYPAFDVHIDQIWFLFPMFIFRNFFNRYFRSKISDEVEKNIRRLVSDMTEILYQETINIKNQTVKYLQKEIETLENSLLIDPENLEKLAEDIRLLQKMNELNREDER